MIVRAALFSELRKSLFRPGLNIPQVLGIDQILNAWDESYKSLPIAWLAYALATTYHETGATMLPVSEIGKGRGKKYGNPDRHGRTYYGRGYVQLTWLANYAFAEKKLGVPLVLKPGLALDPNISAKIMFTGMVEGWFAGDKKGRHTLQRYFNSTVDDPVGARRIINGTDRAGLIAGYHREFLHCLKAAHQLDAAPVPVVQKVAQMVATEQTPELPKPTPWERFKLLFQKRGDYA